MLEPCPCALFYQLTRKAIIFLFLISFQIFFFTLFAILHFCCVTISQLYHFFFMRMIQYIFFFKFYSFSLFFSRAAWPKQYEFMCVCVFKTCDPTLMILSLCFVIVRACLFVLRVVSLFCSVFSPLIIIRHARECAEKKIKIASTSSLMVKIAYRAVATRCQRQRHSQSASDHATSRQINNKKIWRRNSGCLHCILSFFCCCLCFSYLFASLPRLVLI